MPLPFALSGIGGISKVLSGALGVSESRLRSRAGNKRIRQAMVDAASAAIRAGQRSITVRAPAGPPETGDPRARLLRWAGLGGPEGEVGVGMPGADGSRAYAQAALDALVTEGLLTAAYGYRAVGKSPVQQKGKATAASRRGTAARKGSATRGGPRERTYVRYDPDSGERVLVTRDDPRYDEWTNRRPSASRSGSRSGSRRATGGGTTRRRKTRAQKETDAMIRRLSTDVTRAGLKLTAAGVRWFASAAAAAGMSAGVAAALVVGTGLASYAATRWLIGKIERSNDPAYKREQVALAYRRARLEWEQQSGRKLTRLEHDFLARNFKDALRALDAGVSFTPPR